MFSQARSSRTCRIPARLRHSVERSIDASEGALRPPFFIGLVTGRTRHRGRTYRPRRERKVSAARAIPLQSRGQGIDSVLSVSRAGEQYLREWRISTRLRAASRQHFPPKRGSSARRHKKGGDCPLSLRFGFLATCYPTARGPPSRTCSPRPVARSRPR
jgi:hypothetical protein